MSESTQLTLPERAALALGTAKHEKELIELAEQSRSITEIKNKDAREQCHSTAMVLKTRRTSIRKAGKDARDDATKFSKAVIAEEDRLVALIEPDETRLIGLRDVWDAEREAERQAKLAAEQARVDAIHRKIDEIKTCPAESVCHPSASLAAVIELMERHEVTLEEFAEFAGEAEMAKVAALAKLGEMLTAQRAHEAEQARLAEERAQLERDRAAAAERERKEALARQKAEDERRIAQAKADAAALARQRADQKKLDDERREFEQQQAAQQAAADKMAAAMSEIQGIQQQVIIAQSGRPGVRKGGTIECLRETLAETEAWELDPERFGILAGAAESAKTTAVAEIRRLLAEAEARVAAEVEAARIAHAEAERIFVEEEQRRQQAAAEAARIQAEKDAAEAERQRRERVQFELNGPGESEIIRVLAEQFKVTPEVALAWIATFDMAYNDHMEKAA